MIYTTGNIKIQAYSNGSYSYWNERNRRWYNIPSEIAKQLIGNSQLLRKVRNDLEVHSDVTIDTATELFRFFKDTEE